ncbi:hypothetical protein J4226_03845 [Candidatus Pacearchaeota archaeon]|nr:hypothetical protein [Candidatus Pacearchaeota archaeon]
MVLNKKGIFFTLITITILTLFATTYSTYTLFQDREPINSRIQTLNNFVASVEQDLPRQTYISGYRSILLFNKYIVETGTYISDPQASLSELFFNATLNGVPQDLMTDATFSNLESFLQDNAEKINANLTLQNPTITISQDDPWNLKITLVTTLTIQDKGGLATWNKTSITSSYIPIKNFDDPIYSVNTAGKVLLKINQTPYTNFVVGGDYSNLTDHFRNSFYKTSTSGPSFLMRLEGNLSSDPNGIESLVNPQTLANAGISAKYKSVVDYIYFSTDNPTKYSVPAVSNLILDDEDNHLTTYNVSSVAVPI